MPTDRRDRVPRRAFVGAASAAVALAACSRKIAFREERTGESVALSPQPTATIPRRALGKTGETVSLVGLGGFHIGRVKDGKLETFKTTHDHDGTVRHPEWLESASI
jgi:hypothetical protein